MRGLIILVSVLGVLMVPASAGAVELVNPDGSRAEPFQTWADRAGSHLPVPNVRITVAIVDTPCADFYDDGTTRGCYRADRDIIEIARSACASFNPFDQCAQVFLHELGHAVDAHLLTDADRGEFTSLIFSNRKWGDSHRIGSPSEQFADAYESVAMYRRWNRMVRLTGLSLNGVDCSLQFCPTHRRFNRTAALLRKS